MSIRADKGVMAGAYIPYGSDLNQPSDWLERALIKLRW